MHRASLMTPLGLLRVEANDIAVVAVGFVSSSSPIPSAPNPSYSAITNLAITQLEAYFAGQLQQFELPLAPLGTDFQQRVWRVLQTIPYGETWSYQAQAQAMGQPNAVRAVAAANRANPIAIVIPCHRVIGKDGTLRGYAGGLDRKQALIELETMHRSLQ